MPINSPQYDMMQFQCAVSAFLPTPAKGPALTPIESDTVRMARYTGASPAAVAEYILAQRKAVA